MSTEISMTHPLQNLPDGLLPQIFEASRGPLIVTDNTRSDNPIIYSNQAFLDLCGYAMDEIIGRNCRFLQGEDSDKTAVKKLRDAVAAGKSERVTLKNYHKDGTPFWNDLLLSPIQDDRGRITHFMGMQLDVTERILAQQKLTTKTQQLELSNQELEQFTYAASHDLQEPLRMINSYLQLLSKRYGQQLDDDATTFLGYATEGSTRMQELINDLLTLSRLSDDGDRYRTIAVNTVVDHALANLQGVIAESKAVIDVDNLPEMRVDPIQLTQLFQNLISNAIKYRRPDAQPHIRIAANKKGSSYVYSVTDDGIGIDAKHFDRIFTVFQRLHTRSEYPGTGIGLAICSKIVDRHGGKIWVESEPGKGAAFKFSIPIERR